VFAALMPVSASAAPPQNFGGIKVVVDAGHGGHDGGAISPNGLTEKNINLSVAKFLADFLYKAGAKVILTRGDDRFIPLPGRVAIANNNKADLFVAVHQNSAANAAANRTETYFHHPQSARVAQLVQNELVKYSGNANGGSLQAGFHVIRKTAMRSILTEAGFMSNPTEAARIASADFRKAQAAAIFTGLKRAYGVADPVPVAAPAPAPQPVPVMQPTVPVEPPKPAKLQIQLSGELGIVQNKKDEAKVHIPYAAGKDKVISVRNVGEDNASPKVVFNDLLGNQVHEVKPFLGTKNSYSFYPENIVGKNFIGSIDILEPTGQITSGLTAGLAE